MISACIRAHIKEHVRMRYAFDPQGADCAIRAGIELRFLNSVPQVIGLWIHRSQDEPGIHLGEEH